MGVRCTSKSSILIAIFHYKPSSYWGTPMNLGNLHIATVEDVPQLARSTTYFSKEGGSEGIGESVPSELLESLPPEIRTALAERQAR